MKITRFVSVFAFALVLAACGGGAQEGTEEMTTEETTTPAPAPVAPDTSAITTVDSAAAHDTTATTH
jgi:hypothetical protein